MLRFAQHDIGEVGCIVRQSLGGEYVRRDAARDISFFSPAFLKLPADHFQPTEPQFNPDSAVKPEIPKARWNPGAAKASDCEVSKPFCALPRRCDEA
jgi:hypothetical protein